MGKMNKKFNNFSMSWLEQTGIYKEIKFLHLNCKNKERSIKNFMDLASTVEK